LSPHIPPINFFTGKAGNIQPRPQGGVINFNFVQSHKNPRRSSPERTLYFEWQQRTLKGYNPYIVIRLNPDLIELQKILQNTLDITWLSLFLCYQYLNLNQTHMGHIGYYMRTSHYLQNIATQIDRIEDGWKVYKDEGVSGRVSFQERPAGRKLMDDIKRGRISSVIVLRLDRLGRDTTDILNTIKEIHRYNVPITSKNEGITTLIDGKENPMSNLLINILSSLSEFQYHQTREKTLDGISRGKLDGKYKGRKIGSIEPITKFVTKPKVKKIKEMLDENIGVRKISRLMECSPNYVYKVKERIYHSVVGR